MVAGPSWQPCRRPRLHPCPTSRDALRDRSSTSSSRSIRRSRPSIGDHRYDASLARRQPRPAARRGSPSSTAGPPTFQRRWTDLTPTTPSIATCSSGARRRALRRDRAARGHLGPARLGLPPRRRAVHARRPRVRPAGRPARIGRRSPRGDAGPARWRQGGARGPGDGRPVGAVPDRDGASSSSPGIDRADRRRAGRGASGARRGPGGRRAPTATGRRGRARPGGADRLRGPPARRRPAARARARADSAPSCSPRKMRHTMRSDDADAGADPGRAPSASSTPSAPRWSGSPARCGRPGARSDRPPDDDGELVRGVLDAIAAEHPPADELLDFCRAENARIEAFCRERDLIGLADEPLDIRWTPTFLRAFGGAMLIPPGPLDKRPEGVLRDHPDARGLAARAQGVVPARGQRPDAPAPDHPRGGARALPPGRVRQPLAVAAARDLRQRPLRRGLGRVRDPGDDGRRVRRGRPALLLPTGSSTCARSPTRSSTPGSTATG